jgi:hypothetical protein
MEIQNDENLMNLEDKRLSDAGTMIRSGRIYEDYLDSLNTSRNTYGIYNKMRRQDYQCKRMENAITTPIKGGKFRFIPLDDTDEQQNTQAKFKTNLYKKWCNKKWQTTLTEILTYPFFGFAVFEPYSKVVEDPEFGKVITLANLGYIKQVTVEEWDIQDDNVKRIRQRVTTNNKNIDHWIDGNELLIFTNQLEGNNFEGISLFRAAYGNYVRKDLYLRLDMIGNERMAIGTPRVYVPEAYLAPEMAPMLQNIINVLEAYTSHQKAFLVLSDKLKDNFDIINGEYHSEAVDNSIRREDQAMLDSILAGFLAIGTAKSGGNAQNEGQMELYLNSIMFIAEYIAEVLSEVAHQYYVLNFGEPEVRIDMTVSNIRRNDLKKLMEVTRGYVTSNVIEPDDRLERRIRDDLDLPLKDENTARKQEMGKDYKEDQDEQDKENPEKQNNPEPNINEGDKDD